MKKHSAIKFFLLFLILFSCSKPGIITKENNYYNTVTNSDIAAKYNKLANNYPVGIKQIAELTGHSKYVYYVEFSKNQKYLASGSADRTIRIWDCKSWSNIKTIQEGYQELWGIPLDFSYDNKYLAIGSFDTLKIISLDNDFKEINSKFAHKKGIQSIIVSRDNKFIITAGADGELKIWTIPDLERYNSVKGHTGEVWSISISPDNKIIISGGEDDYLRLWKFPSLELIKSIKYHKLPIEYVEFSNNGKFFLQACSDSTISVWRTGDYNSPYRILKGHTGSVLVAVFSKDDRYIISGGDDSTIYVFDIRKGEIVDQRKDHNGDVMSLDISTDGKFLASGSKDRTIKIWSISY